jgi:hypothetical protein
VSGQGRPARAVRLAPMTSADFDVVGAHAVREYALDNMHARRHQENAGYRVTHLKMRKDRS